MKRLLAIAIVLLLTSTASAALTGATGCKIGNLAVIRSDVEAVWSVYPQSYSGCYAVSDDGRTLYFAAPKEGEIMIIAASVNDGRPVIDTHTLYYGIDAPKPEPTPEPKPMPKPETLESQVINAADCLDNVDLTALAESFESVVDSINRGTVTTPAGARETFRAVWTAAGSAVSTETLNRCEPILTRISGLVDNTSLDTIKKDYSRVSKAIRECIKLEVKEPEEEPTPAPRATNTGGCANGQCPNYQPGWRVFR